MDEFALLTSAHSPEPPHGRPYLWLLIILMLVLMVGAVLALGPRTQVAESPTPTVSETPERSPRVYTVTYRFGVFSPTNLRIHQGDTVRFHNGGTSGLHIAAQLQPNQRVPEFDSIGPIAADGYFNYTFANLGTFGYHNVDKKQEQGIVIVR